MILLVDVGNSRIKWAYWQHGALGDVQHAVHRGRALNEVLDTNWRAMAAPSAVYVANVAGAGQRHHVIEWAQRHWPHAPYFVTSQAHGGGVTNAYTAPERLGVDRWLALIAVFQRASLPAVIVNCGTAMTVDALMVDGQHVGGVILPGVHAMLNGLAADTALDKPVDVAPKRLLLAQNTHDAMVSGAWMGLVGAVEYIFDEYAKQWQCEPQLIVGGGDAAHLASLLNRPVQVLPHLVLEGLACLVPTLSSSG